jgi:hypothetical protein
MYVGLDVQYLLFSQILMKLEFSQQIFEKYSNIKFHENLSSGSRVHPCGWTERHEKATNYFHNFLSALRKGEKLSFYLFMFLMCLRNHTRADVEQKFADIYRH